MRQEGHFVQDRKIKGQWRDTILFASIGGRQAIFSQLEKMGLSHANDFVHFLEPVSVSGLTTQVVLP